MIRRIWNWLFPRPEPIADQSAWVDGYLTLARKMDEEMERVTLPLIKDFSELGGVTVRMIPGDSMGRWANNRIQSTGPKGYYDLIVRPMRIRILREEISRLKRNKKKHSHLVAELYTLEGGA